MTRLPPQKSYINCTAYGVDGLIVFILFLWEDNTKCGIPPKCLWTTAHASSINALPPTPRWNWCPIMRRHPCRHIDHLCHQYNHQHRWHKTPLINNEGAKSCWRHGRCRRQMRGHTHVHMGAWHTPAQIWWWHPCPHHMGHQRRQISLTTLCHLQAWGGNVFCWLVVRSRRQGELDRIAKGWWCPCPLPQGRQGHYQAQPVLSCQLGHLPPTHQQTWGGVKGQWHPCGLCKGWKSHHWAWHDRRQLIWQQQHRQMLPLHHQQQKGGLLRRNTALPPHSSAGNCTSGWVGDLPSKHCNVRSASACSCCVAAHRCTSCWFGVIVAHLWPRSTKPPTQRSSAIPSGTVVCCYNKGGGHDKTIILVIIRVVGIGPVLPILEGGRCVCLFVFGLHRLLWQHWMLVTG